MTADERTAFTLKLVDQIYEEYDEAAQYFSVAMTVSAIVIADLIHVGAVPNKDQFIDQMTDKLKETIHKLLKDFERIEKKEPKSERVL